MELYKEFSESIIQGAIKDIDYYGYSKVENFLTSEGRKHLLDMVNKRYGQINLDKKVKYNKSPDRDDSDKILYSVYNIDHCFIDVLSSNLVRKIAMHKLNDEYYRFLPHDVPNYILSYYNARSSGDMLDLHIDSHIPFISHKKTNAIQVAILLEDSVVSNGCTVVVPGSHNSGKYTDRSFANVKPITGRAGDLIVWDSRLWHGTLQNVTKQSRWVLIATLTQWWCKQSVDIVRNVDNNIYHKCSDEQKQLLGFCSIPPKDEFLQIHTKQGYDFLKENVDDYF